MPPKPLEILCFGDSLTEGYTRHGTVYAPYCNTMKTLLSEELKDEYAIDVNEQGISGDMALHMPGRMGDLYGNDRTQESPYDLVIFLGGTNDLAFNRPPQDIFDSIKAVLKFPLDNGARVLVMTIPECGVVSKKLDARRDEVNGLIRGWVGERDDVFLFDLREEIVYHGMGEVEREQIWDDGLHFTAKGYERLGRMVGERVLEILGGDEGGKK